MKLEKLCLSVLTIAALQQASASLLIQENFSYATGNIDGQATMVTGLTGNWTVAGAGTFVVQASSLAFAGHFASSGGSLVLTGTDPWSGANADAAVSATIPPNTIFYASSIMTLDSASNYYNDWVLEQRFNIAPSGGNQTSSGRNIVSAYDSGNSSTRLAGVSTAGDEVRVLGPVAGTKYLFVTAYTSSATDVTEATMYGFDEAAYASYLANSNAGNAATNLGTYATFTATATGDRALSDFDYLQYVVYGGPTGQMDDFRLGTEITDVVNLVNGVPIRISAVTYDAANSRLLINVEGIPAGPAFHLKSSTTLQGWSVLSPAVDFTSATPQPLAVPVDVTADPKRFYRVEEGVSP